MNKKLYLGRTAIALLVLLLVIFISSSYFSWKKNYYHKIYPGITLGNLSLGGLDFIEARNLIAEQTKQIEQKGLVFKHNEKQITIDSAFSSFDSDLSSSILSFNVNETTAKAFNNKANQTFGDYLLHRLKNKKEKEIKAVYSLNKERLKEFLLENFPELETSPLNAHFSLITTDESPGEVSIVPEKIGKEIDYEQVFSKLENNLTSLENKPIVLRTKTKYPEIRASDLLKLRTAAKEIINKGPLLLNFGNKQWIIEDPQLISWFGVSEEGDKLSLNFKAVKAYLEKQIVPEIDREVVRPKFEIENNKVTSWTTGENGQKLNIKKTFSEIAKTVLTGKRSFSLSVDIIDNDDYVSESGFQIKEILGTGFSSFAGSPKNRRHNIKVGADSLHGILIKPGEEFSLIKALGRIDETSDYLPELVIKGDKTIPEYGGGLCQIGTTIFRAALASGLPITARRNHSYRVSYYEPAGTDATIYDPWPDFRFVNDTGNYILIQARIENGSDLYFDFWGIKDGRKISRTDPVIYNIVKPESTKIIETTDLPPGEKKCTERSHNGADAYFDYTVVYPEKATSSPLEKVVRFKSHYVPWREVCLLGVEATSTEPLKTGPPKEK